MDVSLREGSRPFQYYYMSYCRSRALLCHVDSLIENSTLLVCSAEPVLDAKPGQIGKLCLHSNATLVIEFVFFFFFFLSYLKYLILNRSSEVTESYNLSLQMIFYN